MMPAPVTGSMSGLRPLPAGAKEYGVQNEVGPAEAIPLTNSDGAHGTPTGNDSESRVQSWAFVPTRLNTATPVSTVTVRVL
jgi:hypothetical protein